MSGFRLGSRLIVTPGTVVKSGVRGRLETSRRVATPPGWS
jgi:hypothetical protein